ncbi:MAG: hypothetical protein ACREIQ_06170 [Nitrospiria bacterium]
MAQKLAMTNLGEVLDRESYTWLGTNHDDILEAVENEVRAGKQPEDIKLFIIIRTGRLELAMRCEMAARHIKTMEAS